MAARFDALIVPFAGVGCEDSFEIIRDSAELRDTPILGPWLESRVKDSIPSARRSGDVHSNLLHCPPVLVKVQSVSGSSIAILQVHPSGHPGHRHLAHCEYMVSHINISSSNAQWVLMLLPAHPVFCQAPC